MNEASMIHQMTRRKFLHFIALTGASLPLSPYVSARARPEDTPYLANIGIQLYTFRNQLKENFEDTIKAIADMGYQELEAFSGVDLAKLDPIAKVEGLKISSTHIPADQLDNISLLIEQAHRFGIDYLVFPYLSREKRATLDQFRVLADQLNQAGEACQKAGIQLCYHNHSFEFGSIEGTIPMDLLKKELEPDLVKFELDVFWLSVAGLNPAKYIKEMKGRVKLLHLKDKAADTIQTFDEGEIKPANFQALGQGSLAIAAILKAAKKSGVARCFVEQDHSPDPLATTRQSLEYLKKLN